ncbi:MAG: exodeoxyribonuclease V subunit alpha [Microthrixaceae bacterium]|nr:exodeoxyribonuclease V subunit alpha [Microthrixaceae bacterium]
MRSPHLIPSEVAWIEPFVTAGVLGLTEIHLAATLALIDPASPTEVILGAALAARAPQHGSVCVEINSIRHTVISAATEPNDLVSVDADTTMALDTFGGGRDDDDPDYLEPIDTAAAISIDDLEWPSPARWLAELSRSRLVRVASENPGGDLRPLVLDGGRLYLARHWYLERHVAADLAARATTVTFDADATSAAPNIAPVVEAHIADLFEMAARATGASPDPDQVAAAQAVATSNLVVIAGGPGTGKTTTVAHLLAGLLWSANTHKADGRDPKWTAAQATALQAVPPTDAAAPARGYDRIALVAPTGKAAARMTEAIRQAVNGLSDHLPATVVEQLNALEAVTIHRLLGRRGAGFNHGPDNPLPHDLVIIDEVSMVSLSLMAHLLVAIPPHTKVVMVGDPYQLASVEAGTVLGDMVGMRAAVDGQATPPPVLTPAVRSLSTIHRQGKDSSILDLAAAIREGRSDHVVDLLTDGAVDLTWIDADAVSTDRTGTANTAGAKPRGHRAEHVRRLEQLTSEVRDSATEAVRAAEADDIEAALAAIESVKVLCALRRGPTGVDHWNRSVEDYLRRLTIIRRGDWYAGRPAMVTENDYVNHVFNGDVGVALPATTEVIDGPEAANYRVVFARSGASHEVPAIRLDRVTTQWAMSIHKSQGSEFAHAVVVLPPPPARILTRELLYTGVTRAKQRLTVVASEVAIRAAVDRPVARASGMADRLSRL